MVFSDTLQGMSYDFRDFFSHIILKTDLFCLIVFWFWSVEQTKTRDISKDEIDVSLRIKDCQPINEN